MNTSRAHLGMSKCLCWSPKDDGRLPLTNPRSANWCPSTNEYDLEYTNPCNATTNDTKQTNGSKTMSNDFAKPWLCITLFVALSAFL